MPRFIRALRVDREAPPIAGMALLVAMVLSLAGAPVAAGRLSDYRYLSPIPGSSRVSPGNTIVLRRTMDASGLGAPLIAVTGSRSGAHPGTWTLSDDARTWVFTPASPFAPGETVTVRLEDAADTAGGKRAPATTFDFTVADQGPVDPPDLDETEAAPPSPSLLSPLGRAAATALPASLARALGPQDCDTLAVGFLPITVVNSNNPDPGYLFISPRLTGATDGAHLVILDNLGMPIFHRLMSVGASDFTRQWDGRLTFYAGQRRKYYVLDSAYVMVDSIRTGNGYNTDGHELILLPDNHWLLMSYDPQIVDMSAVVPGGNPNATVTGLIIQELDAAKNVVFQWRSWDHYQITDMIEVPGRLLTNATVDYAHGNAIEPDLDGNLLISARHMSEITKVDRQTGATIWRLGPHAKNNQFTFVNDPKGFSHQHDIRRLPNGHITLYDNGSYLPELYSRAVEYDLDEQNLVATQVWEFRQTPDNFGVATGSHRRHDNGGVLINWGLNSKDPKVTDLHADGSKALELVFGDTLINTYRARRLPWRTNQIVPDTDALDFGAVEVGSSNSLPLTVHNGSALPVELTCFASTHPDIAVTESVPLTVPAGGNAPLNVGFDPNTIGPVDATLYLRSVHGTELVAQPVHVTATVTAVGGVGGGGGAGDPGRAWVSVQPNPGSGERTLSFGVPVAGRVTLEIYDLNGRRVAMPFAGVATAGTHRVTWDAKVEDKPVKSGIYFAKLATGGITRTTKLVTLSK